MKKILLSFFLFTGLCLGGNSMIAQTWTNYSSSNSIKKFAVEKDTMWIATYNGLVKKSISGKFLATYTTSNGLCSNEINTIIIDNNGTKWIGTNNGVSSFDGKYFTNYTTNDGLANNKVYDIAIDRNGNICFGTGGGFSLYNRTSWKNYTSSSNGLNNNTVYSIVTDKKGNIWLGTGTGLTKLDSKNNFSSWNFNSVYALSFDNDSNLWVGTNSSGVFKYDGSTWQNYTTLNGLSSTCVYNIATDSVGNIWFGTISGVSKYDGTTWTTYKTTNSKLLNDLIKTILIDKRNQKWIGTDNGISILDSAETSWSSVTTSDIGLINKYVKTIAIDSTGNKWFGTNVGISVYNDSTWNAYTISNGLANNTINTIFVDKKGTKWIGTNGGGANKIMNDGTITQYAYNNSNLKANYVYAITEDSLNRKWFGISGKIFMYDGSTWTSYTTSELSAYNVKTLAIDLAGNIWCGTDGGGVFVFNGSSWTRYTSSNSKLVGNNVLCISIKNREVWLGTTMGVSSYKNSSWTTYTTLNGLLNNVVYAIKIDSAGNKWCGTGSGVSKLNNNTFTNYVISNGLISSTVYTIEIDKYGNKWFGTDGGVSKFKEASTVSVPLVRENDGTNTLSIHPNPLVTESKITFGYKEGAEYSLQLYDLKGTLKVQINGIKNGATYLQRNNLPSGIYIVSIKGQTDKISSRLIIK
ncbi:MAG: two-component regulator propeller domain-containing protein [Paludibacteraceae bacterium]|nr:two-component regulator propeller domain-containing protein [Paludibacteraceae bacterium]